MKRLMPGEARFTVRPRKTGPRTTAWEVYDKVRGSVSPAHPEFGKIAQDHPSEAAAQKEADRLNGS